jgi:hypothetical protein
MRNRLPAGLLSCDPEEPSFGDEGAGRALRCLAIHKRGTKRTLHCHPERAAFRTAKDLGDPRATVVIYERCNTRAFGSHAYSTQKARPISRAFISSLFSE